METAATADKGTQLTAAQVGIQHKARARVTKDQSGSGIWTVKLSREGVGNQAGKKVLGDGSWARLSWLMSSLPLIFLLKIHWLH